MRIFIFDPCFGRMTGHWENYCKRFYHELSKQHEVIVYGQKNSTAAIIENVNFKPLFENYPFIEARNLQDLDGQAKLFLIDLKNLDVTTIHDNDLLIFHSIFPQILTAIVDWTEQLVQQKSVKVALFFQFAPAATRKYTHMARRLYYFMRRIVIDKTAISDVDWLENIYVRYYRRLSMRIQKLVNSGSHRLFTSTEVLAKNFSSLLNAHVENLPMPGPKLSISEALQFKKNESSYPAITIGYFGHSSLEKGGQFLEYIVAQTRFIYPNAKFVLHLNANKDIEPYFTKFANMTDANIECHYGHLEQEQILLLMQKVDLILIPYSAEKYATTPSAIFTEGLPFKKIFVLPKNTWAHLEAKRYNAGYVTFTRYNAKSILKAIIRAIIHFEELQNKSIAAGKQFYEYNNIENYTHLFIEHYRITRKDSDGKPNAMA